ncbi:MAG: enoyl-CoA hydratase/isomerase family protein [Euryarchaeota archaeon]|nr:enoyl-CoA hydratase/isomerase family protein [Euryarchaeota archaeon]MDE2043682.1 enoyl-CoA hydratase/isomerase family protein [Thermoplasmata archaeon]
MAPERTSRAPSAPSSSDHRPAPRFSGARELKDVRYAVSGGVARVTLDRPSSYNAYTTGTLEELAWAVQEAAFDDKVGVVVLTGAGERAFCTGGDVKEYAEHYTRRPHDYWKYMAHFARAVESLLSCGKPTIARLNGITVGGGNELHLACDLSVAASHIYLGQVGVGVGSVACGGATQWLPLAVGDRRARRMLLLNERVPARRAEEWGLVSQVVPSVRAGDKLLEDPSAEEREFALQRKNGYSIDLGPLDRAVEELSRQLLEKFPECLRYTKAQTNFWKELAWHQTVPHAQEWLSLHFASPEVHEGMGAFVEKRRTQVPALRERRATGDGADYFHGPLTSKCPKCGAGHLPEAMTFCGFCGAPLPPAASSSPSAGGSR